MPAVLRRTLGDRVYLKAGRTPKNAILLDDGIVRGSTVSPGEDRSGILIAVRVDEMHDFGLEQRQAGQRAS